MKGEPKNVPNQDGLRAAGTAAVRIFGIGTAGAQVIAQMLKSDFAGASFVSVDTDATAAAIPGLEKLYLETRLLRGLGTGGDPDRGRAAAEENFQKLNDACAGSEVCFIIAGLGGGTGTGISPVLARAAKKAGALTVAFVTLPFNCEGRKRQEQAEIGLQELLAVADAVVSLPCQKVFKLIDENTTVIETFNTTGRFLIAGAHGMWRLLSQSGLTHIHRADLRAFLNERSGECRFATVEAAGNSRAQEAVEHLIAHPMLENGAALSDADAVLVSLLGGPDMTMAHINRVMEQINQHCSKARVVMGAAVHEALHERLCVTVLAARGCERTSVKQATAESAGRGSEEEATPEFDTELLRSTETKRPPSRLVPPLPALTTEQREEILARHAGKAASMRRKSPKMRQTQLPLEIVTKGRFDRTEPTVHKGEDLDLPTYVRRGIALN